MCARQDANLITPDHPTFLRTKTHSHGYVPFTLAGTGITPDDQSHYHEGTAAATGLTFNNGWDLMPHFFGKS
jgi:2,3-bisphosphoglycerate-independent phosphoglycerate mutase